MPVLKKQNADGTWDMVTSDSQEYATKTEFNLHVTDSMYQIAGGTATAITLTINGRLINGFPITFIASAANSGAATSINGKPLYKPNTTTAPNLITGKAYTVWYSSTGNCFFIKASAEGNTVPSHVLAGDTFSTDADTGILGTMANNGAVVITPEASDQNISVGYHNGNGKVKGDSNLVEGNIKIGTSVFGVIGTLAVHGSAIYSTPGTYTWTVPKGITYVTAVVTAATGGGGGGGGQSTWYNEHINGVDYPHDVSGGWGSSGTAGGVTSFGSFISLTASNAGGGAEPGHVEHTYLYAYGDGPIYCQHNGANGTDYGGGGGGTGGGTLNTSVIPCTFAGGKGGDHGVPTSQTQLISVTEGQQITVTVGLGGAGGAGGVGVPNSSVNGHAGDKGSDGIIKLFW